MPRRTGGEHEVQIISFQGDFGDGKSGAGVVPSASKPSTFIKGTSVSNNDWTTQDDGLWNSSKTKYDPCPAGYRVPDGDIWTKAGFGNSSGYNYGYNFQVLSGGGTTWYPTAGYIDEDGKFRYASSHGGYWACSPYGYQAKCLMFGSNYVDTEDHSPRATAQSVRCQKIQ